VFAAILAGFFLLLSVLGEVTDHARKYGLLPQISMPEGGLAYGDSSVLDFGATKR
jgi:hypothetical protein